MDYSPRNHVAQLNYQRLQRLHLLLRHSENALFNQPITAKMPMTPAHKETLLHCPSLPPRHCCECLRFLSAPRDVLPTRQEKLTHPRESYAESPDNVIWLPLLFTILHFQFSTFSDESQVVFSIPPFSLQLQDADVQSDLTCSSAYKNALHIFRGYQMMSALKEYCSRYVSHLVCPARCIKKKESDLFCLGPCPILIFVAICSVVYQNPVDKPTNQWTGVKNVNVRVYTSTKANTLSHLV